MKENDLKIDLINVGDRGRISTFDIRMFTNFKINKYAKPMPKRARLVITLVLTGNCYYRARNHENFSIRTRILKIKERHQILKRGGCSHDILFKMCKVLHIGIDHIQPVFEDIGISSLEWIEG